MRDIEETQRDIVRLRRPRWITVVGIFIATWWLSVSVSLSKDAIEGDLGALFWLVLSTIGVVSALCFIFRQYWALGTSLLLMFVPVFACVVLIIKFLWTLGVIGVVLSFGRACLIGLVMFGAEVPDEKEVIDAALAWFIGFFFPLFGANLPIFVGYYLLSLVGEPYYHYGPRVSFDKLIADITRTKDAGHDTAAQDLAFRALAETQHPRALDVLVGSASHEDAIIGSSGFLVDVRSTPAPLCSFCGTGIDHCALA